MLYDTEKNETDLKIPEILQDIVFPFNETIKTKLSNFNLPLTIDKTIVDIYIFKVMPKNKSYYERENIKFKLIYLCNILLNIYRNLLKKGTHLAELIQSLFIDLKKIVLKELFYRN